MVMVGWARNFCTNNLLLEYTSRTAAIIMNYRIVEFFTSKVNPSVAKERLQYMSQDCLQDCSWFIEAYHAASLVKESGSLLGPY